MRCFISLDPPDALRKKIEVIQGEMKKSGADLKWVDPEKIHLTFFFFADLKPEEAALLSEKIKGAVAGIGPFDVVAEGVGGFPSGENPRVVWVGIAPSEKLDRLYRLVRKSIEETAVSMPEEKEQGKFKPHLTVGRVRSRKNLKNLVEKIKQNAGVPVGSFQANELFFYESRLNPEGPVYTPHARFSL